MGLARCLPSVDGWVHREGVADDAGPSSGGTPESNPAVPLNIKVWKGRAPLLFTRASFVLLVR